jgi:hypothetical protein
MTTILTSLLFALKDRTFLGPISERTRPNLLTSLLPKTGKLQDRTQIGRGQLSDQSALKTGQLQDHCKKA